MFSFFSGRAAAFVYSEAVMAIAVQADGMLRATEPLFFFIRLPSWPLPPASRVSPPTLMTQDQAGKPSQKHPWRRRARSQEAQPRRMLASCQGSQPWSKREFVFSLLCLGQNQRTYWTPPACLFTLPSFSPCSQLTAALVEVGGSLVFTGKHKKQRRVPKCLT